MMVALAEIEATINHQRYAGAMAEYNQAVSK